MAPDDPEPTAADIPGTSAKAGLEEAAQTISRMQTDTSKMAANIKQVAASAKEMAKAFTEAGKNFQAPTAAGAGNTGAGSSTMSTSLGAVTVGGGPRPDVFAEGGVSKPSSYTGFVPNLGGQAGQGGAPGGTTTLAGGGSPAGNAADSGGPVAEPAASPLATRTVAAHATPVVTAGGANAGQSMGGSITTAAASPVMAAGGGGGGGGGNAPVGGGLGAGGVGGGAGTGMRPGEEAGDAPVQQTMGMVGSGQGTEEAGGGGGAVGMVLKGAKWAGSMAMAAVNDLRFGRAEGLRYERSRLIAFGGTGNFDKFRENLAGAMNGVNVQNRGIIEQDLAEAYGNYYMQGLGGGEQGAGRTAQTVGSMHTLASIAGVDPEKVGSALDNMYSAPAFYKAMATGIMTRDPTTGDMMTTDEIVNQYRGRFSGKTPDQIRRALAPGGSFRAELNQTWGDSGLVEMISEGILTTSKTGKAIEGGKIMEAVSTKDGGAGYAGSEWTQGKDSESRRLMAEENRLARYDEYITEGISQANTAVTAINELLTSFKGPLAGAVGYMEQFGAAMDTFNTTMPRSTAKMVEAIEGLTSKILGWLTGGLLTDIMGVVIGGAGHSEGDWFVNKDKPVNVHQGEMILPNRIATAVRSELQMGRSTADTPSTTHNLPQSRGRVSGTGLVNIYVTVQNASEAETLMFARKVKGILESDNELVAMGVGQFG